MKLWQKNIASVKEVETFTVGKDRELDLYLAPFDVLGSLAHIKMLQTINLITSDELSVLQKGLKEIYKDIQSGKFKLDDGVEDIHSQVEIILTKKFGDAGKKIHRALSFICLTLSRVRQNLIPISSRLNGCSIPIP